MKPSFNAAARLKGMMKLKAGHVIDGQGNHAWYYHLNLHRADGPAWISKSGTKKWFKYGVMHRGDGPAIEWADGDKEWYVDGKRHREGGPAIEKTDGYKAWYVEGKLHRADGPAIIHPDGKREWYKDGVVWKEGEAVTTKIEAAQKAQQVEEAVKGATVAEENIQILKPIKLKKPQKKDGQSPAP